VLSVFLLSLVRKGMVLLQTWFILFCVSVPTFDILQSLRVKTFYQRPIKNEINQDAYKKLAIESLKMNQMLIWLSHKQKFLAIFMKNNI
jgi:hypothetical protein